MTKHQPATPLPWYPAYGLSTGAVHSKPLNEQTAETRLSAKNLKRADAAYMYHAANAYPKLVERTQRRESWMRSVLAALPKNLRPIYEEAFGAEAASDAALLRDLGEAE